MCQLRDTIGGVSVDSLPLHQLRMHARLRHKKTPAFAGVFDSYGFDAVTS
jgi:hypothetical protein